MYDTYIGQAEAKLMMRDPLAVFHLTGQPLPNILLDWPSGYGKSAFGKATAAEMSKPYLRLDMSSVAKKGFGEAMFRFHEENLNGGLIMLDEIQAISRNLRDGILFLLEDKEYQYDSGRYGLDLSRFSFMAATTDGWKLSEAIWSRFKAGLILPCSWYENQEMEDMFSVFLGDAFKIVGQTTVQSLVPASSNEPRQARAICDALLRKVTLGEKPTPDSVRTALGLAWDGLRKIEIQYLSILAKSYKNAPGQATSLDLAKALKVNHRSLWATEALLERKGYMNMGMGYLRELTEKGRERLAQETHSVS